MTPRDFVFAHLADAHVGAWARDPAIRAALRESVVAALRTVAQRSAQFLLISGDLFHTPVPDPEEVAPVVAELRNLAASGVRIYAVFGSHDYVVHRTSWLDVLAESGLFVRVAPEAVRPREGRWPLPFLVDQDTGAVIAGISGRSHGLDRDYYRSMDPSAFVETPGFHIFMFHAAVNEYLPEGLRAHIRGVAVEDLPPADYYAGGHIHRSYTGRGPTGGLLVNPGAVFGTSVTDVAQGARGLTHRGVVIVTVRDGTPAAEFVDTVPAGSIDVFDVDLSGTTGEEARLKVREQVRAHTAPGALLFPHLTGVGLESRSTDLGLTDSSADATTRGVATVHWDLGDFVAPPTSPVVSSESDPAWDESTLHVLRELVPPPVPGVPAAQASELLRDLVRELGTPIGDGEAKEDYRSSRVNGALRLLGIASADAADRSA